MPRTARADRGGVCFHVLSRGNGRAEVFHSASDYERFQTLMDRGQERLRLELLAWCLMPNHVHLVVRPARDGDLGRWMHWLLTSHVQHHRCRYETSGRVWQGRFKAFPIQSDRHLLTVLRYVERNPLRAGLVDRAGDWPWSSHRPRGQGDGTRLDPSPVPIPGHWAELVHGEQSPQELESIRQSVERQRPFGDSAWVRGTCERLGLVRSLAPRGRPRTRVGI